MDSSECNKNIFVKSKNNKTANTNISINANENIKKVKKNKEGEKALTTSDYFANKDISISHMEELPTTLATLSTKIADIDTGKIDQPDQQQIGGSEYDNAFNDDVVSETRIKSENPSTNLTEQRELLNTENIYKKMSNIKQQLDENITIDEVMTDIVGNELTNFSRSNKPIYSEINKTEGDTHYTKNIFTRSKRGLPSRQNLTESQTGTQSMINTVTSSCNTIPLDITTDTSLN